MNINRKLKQFFFAHSGGKQGCIGEGSFDLVNYLKTELSAEYEIHYPIIKNPEEPTYEMWKNMFEANFNKIKESDVLIGHSLGSSMLLKYLSEELPKISAVGLYLVSTPCWGKYGWDVDDFVLKDNFEEKLKSIPHIYLYHSINDEIIPYEHLTFYKKSFPHSVVRELKGKDHAFANGLPELVLDIRK